MWSTLSRIGLLVGFGITLCGCGGRDVQPDLARLYGSARGMENQPPVVLIHGILGSKLRDDTSGQEVWLGPLRKLLFSSYEDLALAIDPQTLEPLPDHRQAFAITDQAAGTDFYGRIIQTLAEAGGYAEGTPGTAVTDDRRRYYVFLYDWRQDNVKSAARLNQFIEQIRRDHADPDLKVDIVAHSMGGLVTRYFLRYGEEDVLDDNEFPVNLWGRERVRRVILLGTPNLGSANSVGAFIAGQKVGLRRIPTEVLATMPSVYQLFPHPLVADWMVTTDGRPLKRDLFDANLWRRFEWSVFDPVVIARIKSRFDDPAEGAARVATLQAYFAKRIERARRFVWSLTVELTETPWELVVFGGDCELTPARLVVEEVDGDSVIRLNPNEIAEPVPGIDYEWLMLEPGDGTVTKASLLSRQVLDPSVARHPYTFFPLDYAFFICESHDQLTGNPTFQNNLLHALLKQ